MFLIDPEVVTFGRYGVLFVWVWKLLIRVVNRTESVTNLQGRMEVYRLGQVSEIFAKSAWGILRAVFDSKLARLT